MLNYTNDINAQLPIYSHYDINNGLNSNLVYCNHQNKKGILWFGTDNGLIRFDNNKFRLYSIENGLPDPEVISLFEDFQNRLWVICFRKKLSYILNDKIYNNKNNYNLDKIELKYGICNLFEDFDSTIWVCNTTEKIYRIIKNKIDSLLMPSTIMQIGRVNGKLIAFGSGYIFDLSNQSNVRMIFDIVKELKGIPNYVGVGIINNKFLYSFSNKILLFELKEAKVNVISKIDSISGRIYTDKEGRFWVCSASAGAICFDNLSGDLLNPKVFLAGKKVTQMQEDDQGNYWFSTLDEGIYMLAKNSSFIYDKKSKLKSNNIICVNKINNLLFGDDEGNFSTIQSGNINTIEYKSIDGYNRIVSILPLQNKNIWIASDEGVYVQFPNGKSHKLDITSSSKALLYTDQTVWCGTSSELYAISPETFEKRMILNQRVTALGKDADGVIWVGGIEGLYSSKDSFQFNYGKAHELLQSRIIAIQGGDPGELWVATPESGLLKLSVSGGKINRVIEVNKILHLSIDNIHAIFREMNGRLWLSTNRGVYGINPKNWLITHYDHHYGLANDDVRSVFVQADTLWAATASGVTRILLHANSTIGEFPTFITSIGYQTKTETNELFLNDSISIIRETVLPADASLVKINFTGLDYKSRGSLAFDCTITELLAPVQWWTVHNLTQWIGSGFKGHRSTTLVKENLFDFGVSLAPGRYKINVTAITQNDVRSNQPDEWAIVMPAKWYETLWFTLLLWALFGLGIYRIYQTREKLRGLVIAVAQTRLLALQAQINPHFIGNAINAVQRFFYPPDPTYASIYTATFTRLLRKTLYFSEMTFIPFEQELDYDKDYMNLARLRLGKDKFYYEITGDNTIPNDLPFPALFLQPILENASIHGTDSGGFCSVKIDYTLHEGKLICTIVDSGPGINSAKKDPQKNKNHKSKGIEMLYKKAATLNQLFGLDLQLAILDMSDGSPSATGTKAIISFKVDAIIKAEKLQELLDKQVHNLTS